MRTTIAPKTRPRTWELLARLAKEDCQYLAFPPDFPRDLAMAFAKEYNVKIHSVTSVDGVAILRW